MIAKSMGLPQLKSNCLNNVSSWIQPQIPQITNLIESAHQLASMISGLSSLFLLQCLCHAINVLE